MNNLLVPNPLVSICIPTYNGARFLGEAIASVSAQTYRPIEILVSDDHSQDQTVEIGRSLLDQIQDPDCSVKIFSHDRYGLAGNWNFCIAQATGKYIKFLFQDDLLLPQCLEQMVSLAETDQELGLIFSRRGIICEDGLEFDSLYVNITSQWQNLGQVQSGRSLLEDANLLLPPSNKIGEPSNVLLRSSIFAQVGDFDPSLVQVLDWDMWLRVMANYKIGFIDQVLVNFRVHSQQVSQVNAQSGASWLDDWQLQLKMLGDRTYDFLPDSVRQQVFRECLQRMQTIHQEVLTLRSQIQLAHSDRQNSATELAKTQNQFQQTQLEFSELYAKIQLQLEQSYQESGKMQTQLISQIDRMAQELQLTHLSLADLGNQMQSLHQSFLTKQIQLEQTQTELDRRNCQIREMESSKFWKLRNAWFKLKCKLGFRLETT